MDLLIVSGLSGAGKSVAMNALEDIGFFCIDNVPAELLPSITAFSKAGDNQLKRVALSMDVRGCHTSEQIEQALHQLDEQGIEYEILFIDAPDDVLMRRYSETAAAIPSALPRAFPPGKRWQRNGRSCSPSGSGQTTPSPRSFSPRPRTRSAFVICLRQMAGQRQQCGSP